MDHWRQMYPDQIFSISYERLVTDQETALRELLGFCQLDWQDACLNHHENIGLVKTASDDQVRKPLHSNSINRWQRVERYLEPARALLDLEGHQWTD